MGWRDFEDIDPESFQEELHSREDNVYISGMHDGADDTFNRVIRMVELDMKNLCDTFENDLEGMGETEQALFLYQTELLDKLAKMKNTS